MILSIVAIEIGDGVGGGELQMKIENIVVDVDDDCYGTSAVYFFISGLGLFFCDTESEAFSERATSEPVKIWYT